MGRGPLAGPVAIGAVVFKAKHGRDLPAEFLAARDSKQLTHEKREEWYGRIKAAREKGVLDYRVAFVSAAQIDKQGIVPALNLAMRRALARLDLDPTHTLVLLDGSLYAPEHFLFQQTIVGGDRSEPIISLASIAAKVLRDRKMSRLAREFPRYGFEIHKGYGTGAHIKALKKHGPSEVHRRSFIKSFI